MARFNLSTQEMFAIVAPWARGEWIEFGERKWNPHEARLTVLEGPEIPVNQLRVGRGWRLAQRQATDVTERVLAAALSLPAPAPATGAAGPAEQSPASPAPAAAAESARWSTGVGSTASPPDAPSAGVAAPEAPDGAPADIRLLADSLGLQLLALLEQGSAPLTAAWELAETRLPGGAASESLLLAERAVRSLLDSGLVVLFPVAPEQGGGEGDGGLGEAMGEGQVEETLRSLASWSGSAERSSVRMRRP
jgi:hypothetical protein